jgi:hypothetical protein
VIPGPTVRQLLAGPTLHRATLVGGADGLHRTVSEVHACAPDEPDLSRFGTHAGLVLDAPSGYQLEMLLPRARAADASLLAVHIGPEAVLSSTRWLADRLALPLVVVPEPAPLDVAQRLHAVVHGDETRRGLICAELAQRVGRQPPNPAETVTILNELLPARCATLGAEGTPLAGDPPKRRLDRTLRLGVAATIRDEAGAVVALPVRPVDRRPPSLWLIAETDDLTEGELVTVVAALGVASWAVAAWSASHQLDAARDAAFQTVALTELLTSGDQVTPQTVEHALEAGWQLDGWHIGVRILPADSATRRRQAELSFASAGKSASVGTSVLRGALEASGISGPLVELGDGWAAWLSQHDEPAPSRFSEVIAGVRRALARVAGVALVAGIGKAQPGPRGLTRSLTEAWELARIAGFSPGRRRVEHAAAADPRRLVLAAVSGDETVRRSNRLLGALLEQDHAVLLDTLDTYLTLESSTTATATRLHVHRNTVLKRLERIEGLLDVRLDDPAIRFALRIACRAAR